MSTKKNQSLGSKPSSTNGKATGSSPANAWSRPLQAKRLTGPPPGMGPRIANSPPPTGLNASSTPSSLLLQNRERLLHLSLTLVGQKVTMEQVNGAVIEGKFHTFTPFTKLSADSKNNYVLKEIRVQKPPSTNGGHESLKDGSTLIVPASKVVYLCAKNIDLCRLDRPAVASNGNGSGVPVSPPASLGDGFATDSQISGSKGGRNRDLVAAGSAWTTGAEGGGFRQQPLSAQLQMNSGSQLQTNSRAAALGGPRNNNNKGPGAASGLEGSIGKWDQFKANEELFNVNASFDENLYTTELDKGSLDAKTVAEAERIAREIESSVTDNIHMAEERGQEIKNDVRDEEDRYSTVLTKDGKQRHEVQSKQIEKSVEPDPGPKTQRSVITPFTSAAAKKTMNYAAAAAATKADNGKKKNPSKTEKDGIGASLGATLGPTEATTEVKQEVTVPATRIDVKPEEKETKQKESPNENADTSVNPGDEIVEKEDNKQEAKKEIVKTSKLNANAKAFTFNPQAKSFTPSYGEVTPATGAHNSKQHVGVDLNIPIYPSAHPLQQHPHYMPGPPIGQPGMISLINQQYPGIRFQPQYGRDQTVPQMHQMQGVVSVPSDPTTGLPAVSNDSPTDDDPSPNHEGEAYQPSTVGQSHQNQPRSQQSTIDPQALPQQHQMSVHYGFPPGAYFPGVGMPPRPGYPPQFVPGAQQIPGRSGVAPYGVFPMQPGGMPPNIQMRGPAGTPYYPGPNGPMPYPSGAYIGHGMEDGGDPNFRGRGRGAGGGRGRGRGRGGRGGRGRGYNNNHQGSGGNNSGRNTPQQNNQQQKSSLTLQSVPSDDNPPAPTNQEAIGQSGNFVETECNAQTPP